MALVTRLLPLPLGLLFALPTGLSAQSPRFEVEVRPLLATRCYRCHGPDKQKSGLRLDHIDHILAGGTRGPAVDRTDPAASRLLTAIGYRDSHLQMPPPGPLPEGELAVLRGWVMQGAPWPREPLPRQGPTKAFDLDARRARHWAWQPIRRDMPPTVDDPSWRENPIDRFIFTELRARGLRPAPVADRATLLRRVTFDLTGLPPTPTELDDFVEDPRPGAYLRVVDRLLASSAYGEHQARHWMDLVRFSETLGHEFDYPIPNAWRYRDYLVRAFCADLPFDQFVREHIAGDLLPKPRLDPLTGNDESILATGFYWFGDQSHAPVDVRKATADRTDGQIDVVTKTFLGLTVSCARCHDHKFDAISTADYYALSGYLKSSRYMQRDTVRQPRDRAGKEIHLAARVLRSAWAEGVRSAAATLGPDDRGSWGEAAVDKAIAADPFHPMHGFAILAAPRRPPGGDARAEWLAATRQPPEQGDVRSCFDFRVDSFQGWFQEGDAFGSGPVLGQTMIHSPWIPTAVHTGGWAHSGARGLRGQGVLHSPRFTIDPRHRYLHILAHGRESRIKVVLEGFHLIRDPIYGELKQFVNSTTPRWFTIDLGMWPGRRAYLAFCDQIVPDLADTARTKGYRPGGYIAVQRAVFSSAPRPPHPQPAIATTVFGAPGTPVRTLAEATRALRKALVAAAEALAGGRVLPEQARLLNWLWERGRIPADQAVAAGRARLFHLEEKEPAAVLAPAMADGTGEDEHIFLRGSHTSLGPVSPRRNLSALENGGGQGRAAVGSGRLELAERMVADDNPLTARVAVNRFWHHLFGRGLVATVDNFGAQGTPPSHPDLLDWLAHQFVADGWSVRTSLRRMVLSRTYRMASAGDPAADAEDPDAIWLHRMRVRRLPAEAIRDAILAVSGRLDRRAFGPSVANHLTRFMTGRGRPASGPRDGEGRRSLYLRVSRNFLSPFLLAFDFPQPAAPMGRRDVTLVPAQALALLNDPFVHDEAMRWAQRLAREPGSPGERVWRMYRAAFARPPRPGEATRVETFLHGRAEAYGCDLADPRPWRDLCHALFNLKEFVFYR